MNAKYVSPGESVRSSKIGHITLDNSTGPYTIGQGPRWRLRRDINDR